MNKVVVVEEKDVARILSVRTGLDTDIVLTLMHYYERVIIHSVLKGRIVRMNNLFIIYSRNDEIVIELTDKAMKYLKKK